jgi:hypothetical protein
MNDTVIISNAPHIEYLDPDFDDDNKVRVDMQYYMDLQAAAIFLVYGNLAGNSYDKDVKTRLRAVWEKYDKFSGTLARAFDVSYEKRVRIYNYLLHGRSSSPLDQTDAICRIIEEPE